ncbi:MAG: YIP1 family protein [Actinobacteria bacterium]|nr:YIP1 family protein [Actinomycetota bacterium]
MATAEVAPDSQRAWWLRALLVLQAPRPVFVALRDESPEAADARSEPATALVFLAGIGAVLLAPAFGHLFDDYALDSLDVLVIVVFAGSLYGFFSYWILGWTLSLGVRTVGGEAPARRCRHVLAFAVAPLVLSLLAVWPLRLALYGSDVFRYGGSDAGTGGQILRWLSVAFAAWSFVLLVYGIRTVQRCGWLRALGATGFAIGLVGLVLALWAFLPAGK